MKKKFVRLISAVLSAAMTLTAVPLSAFAEGEAHTHDGESNVITTPLDFREKTADENGVGWSWDYDTKTLTLDGVNIQATTEENMMSVVTVPDGTKIVLNGENTIVQTDTLESDTYVLSAVNNKEVNCDGTMTISGDGVLNAENRSTDSMARSLGGSIILNGGTVNATGTVKTNSLEIHNDGVLNANATTASFEGVAVNVSGGITVDGNGSLTAVGCANESTLNSAILLTSNFGDKISVSENGSITVPEGNAARVGIYYSGNNGDGMDAEISGGKVTAYGAKYGIYKVNLIMSGTGSVYTTGGSYAIGLTVPTIDENRFTVKGSTEFKASESAVTGEVELPDGYYYIDGADAKTVVIKPDTSPRIILGKQTGIFKTEEYEIIEGMTDTKLKGTVYFDITLKNMSDEEFADARGYFGGDEPDLSASIIKTDYGWVCMVCDTEFSVTYDTDNTLTIKCGDIVSNTVQVKSNANRFNKVTQGDNTNRTVFYTNTSQEEKDNYKLVSTYTVDSESISYNWYSTNSAYSADELGAAVSGSNGEFKLADNIPAGNYVLYCDITYSDGDSTETVTEKFTFTYKECAHENGYSDGKCTNCGALCDHSNIDINTGKCNECEHQFVATISTDGNAPTGYDTLADCLNSITADTGNYVKIYQDIGDASATATLDTIDVKHNVMIDLNGHKLNNIKLEVNKDVTLTLTGTEGSYVDQVYVCKGGSFIIDSEANVEFDTIFAEAGTRFTVSDGANVTVRYLAVKESLSNEGNATSVKLATGMKITEMLAYDLDNSSPLSENIMLKNLLSYNQMLKYESSSKIINLYYGATRIIINSKTYGYGTITVVEHTDADHKYSTGTGKCEECGKPCEHGGDINTDTGICSICGAVVSVAIYTDANGISKYVDTDELHSLLNEYNGSGTIKLFKDYDNSKAQYDLYGELTIDLNGRRLNIRSITPCKNGKLTIKNSGNPVMLGCNVYPTNDASYAGGTLIIDGDVVLDTSIYVYDSSTVILKDGTYPAGLYARDSKTLYDMLGEGKAFFKTDGTLFNASVKEISSSVTLIVKDHSHTYVDGKCGCGYVCTHSDVDSETGKCTECEYQYAAVIVKDGAAASVYKETEMEAAFETADSEANTGCTLRVYKNYTGSYTTLSGKFTMWIAEKANVGTLTVSGDITVTGSGKNNRIYGDFNVAAGGKLTFDEKCGAMGTVSVGAGTFDCYSTFSITLNINDASSDVILHGGAFKTICYNGGGDRANAEILTLLAENRMFMKSPNPEPIDGSKTLLKDGFATPVIVIPHEGHSYDSTTGKCTICGKRCGHTDVDSKTGVCSVCEYQLTAGISGVGTAKYFDNIDDAFTAALSAENNGCTLTLYKNCEITQNVEIGNTKVTVDVNGYLLGEDKYIVVNSGGILCLKDSRKSTNSGCVNAPLFVKGGTFINGTADGSSSAADVQAITIISAKRVEIYGGVFGNVYISNASGVAIYGGRYSTIGSGKSNSTPVNTLLAKGYAFATLNSVTHLPESIVDGSAVTLSKGIRNVTVVAHTHTYDETNTKCDCGAVLYAKVTSADGTTNEYFDSIEEGLLYADKAENKGCVFTLVTSGKINSEVTLSNGKFTITTSNYGTIYDYNQTITIDGADVIAEGYMFIKCKVNVKSGSLTLPEGSSAGFDSIAISGGTVTVSEGVNVDNNAGADNLFVSEDAIDAKLTIGGGTYGRIVLGQFKLKDVIASGVRVISYDNPTDPTAEKTAKALLYSDIAEKNNFDSENNTVSYYLFTKCEHKNEDGSYAFNEGGICKYCNSEFAASVSYTVDGSAKTELFGDIYDAFDKANEIGTATVTLYKDITDDITDTIAVTGNVTLELNGKRLSQPGTDVWYSIEVTSGKLTVNGSGLIKRVAVCNGSDAEINGGTLSDFIIKDGGNAVIKGGQFYSLQVSGEGRNVGQLLADGYAYWSFIDSGIWSTIAERKKQDITNVEVKEAPIKSATATVDKTVLYRNGGGARQILFNFNVNTSDGYTISDANKVTVGLYVGDTLIRELDFVGNSYTFANADEISDTDGTVKAHLVIKLNGYEYVTDDVEFEIATCTHPYDALTTDEYDYYRCSLCDASINAILVKTNGDKACYTDNVPEAFEAAQLEENNGCTLELYRGVNRDCEITQGSFTVLFKKTGSASAVIKVSGGNVKITGDDGCTLSKYPGSSVGYLIAVTGGTVTFDDITINDDSISVSGGKTVINGGTYNKLSVSGGTVTINSGTFSSIDVSAEGKALKDLLGENKAFTTSDGKLFDASKVSESDMSLTVIDHSKHEYDETGRCGCGYQCAHSEINAEGVCNECNAKMYVAVTVKSETGTTVKYFTKLTEAFEFAAKNENKGCTLKMLRDFFDRNTDINVNGGKLTVDMNGFGVYFNSFNGSGTQITIRSDSKCTFGVENGFSMDGGTVTFSGEVSVVCQNVKLNATYFSSYVETLKIDTLILEDGVLLKQLASITNANIANIDCSSEIYLYQILASGSRVDSQLYSDLKANASSNFDNVRIIRCDHPDGVGRDNRCIYCNSLIAASVSYTENGAEKTEYFVKEDLGKAFAKANSVAIATITMLMSSAYDTDYLPVTGDVTLIANGDNAILYNTVKVADGGKLTLRGNANIFAVIAEPGSRLTAEEATRIAYLTVNGGDVKLSGGQYDNITVKDGKITDILGNGYAYKKTEGGAWLTLKEREVSEASGVTVAKAPIVQATLSTEINKLYRNSNANPTLKFNLALAHGSNLNDSYVSKRYGINSYVSGDIIYSSLSALVTDAKLSADEIIDKAGDSDVAEIYFVVTTGDGYEIKSNTVSIDLVDCDHSQVVDPTADKETAGNITEPTYCEICESKFNAKITKGDDVRYYNDLDEAAKDAQKSENEGCILYPLYNKNGYGGQLVITEGNFTLKYAVRTAFSRPIIINGKAKLTVTGRCAVTAFENQDAFIVRGGDVTFDGLATGSNVTINGGNVTMAANNINCLTINGGNVSISSGGFAEIVTTVSDKVIADYIDHGFWVQDRGTKEWIDIYSLNKATASSTNGFTVRLCPMQIIKPIDTVYYTNGYYPDGIPSLQISAVPWYSGEVDANVAYQWIVIDENGNETEIEGATDRKLSLENLTTGRYYCRLTYSNAATAGVSMKSDVVTATITECKHSGGEATCTEKAKCEICGAEYGEPLGHNYVVIKIVEPDYRNEGYSVFECTRCKDSYIGNRVPVKPIPDVEEIAVEKTTYNEVDISWKNISGVDGYYVECYVGNQWKQIGFSTDGDRVAAKLSGLSAGLKYKVRIAAYAGSFTAKFRCFYVDTVPSPVWNINTVKATDETVRISWSRNARADGYKVEWYINNQWSVKTVTGNNNISAVIDGLCAGTRYKVRVSAYKGDLYSPYTYGYIDTLPSKVTGITQTVTSSSFTLKWDKNESADGYTAQYYADGKWNEKTLTGNKKTTVTIGSLKGYKTYKVRIKAYKGELESAFDDIYITTAPTKVSGLKVKSAVDSKAVVIWNADANADGYNVGYYIGGKWVEKTITDNKTAKAVLGGLTPYSTCKVRVRAYKDNLYGDYSYTTVTAVLSPVTNIKVVSAKSNSITVKWGKNASADGYKVEIYKGGKWVKKTLKGSTNATVTIGGLRAGSVYKVRIASYKGANTSTYTYANVKTAK